MKSFKVLSYLIEKALHSTLHLWILNQVLARLVPFNKPHGIRILSLSRNKVSTGLPYRRSNRNHVRGSHACALATVCEFAAGVAVFANLEPSEYRLIMTNLEMSYHAQGRKDVRAVCCLEQDFLDQYVLRPLQSQEAVEIKLPVECHDVSDRHIATAQITWQIKPWTNVTFSG